MKKFICKVLAYLLIISCITIIPAYTIDPYNVFHWDAVRNNGVEPNKNYIKTKYVINNPDLFEGYILGSSRVCSIHPEKINSEQIYNMTYSQGTPAENLETIQALIENDVTVKSIYLGVDSLSYIMDSQEHCGAPLHASYQELQNLTTFCTVYMNPLTNFRSLSVILKHNELSGMDTFYTAGWAIDYNEASSYDWENATPSMPGVYSQEKMDSTLEAIRYIKALCDAHGIRLVIWTNPLYKITYEASLEAHYMDFLRELAEITPYYNFSGLNRITADSDNYVDTSHYKAEIGDMVIAVVWNGVKYEDLYDDGFGWYVTEENVEELIKIIE